MCSIYSKETQAWSFICIKAVTYIVNIAQYFKILQLCTFIEIKSLTESIPHDVAASYLSYFTMFLCLNYKSLKF